MSRYIDAEHLKRWIIARWEERDATNPYPLSGKEILDQIEREEYFTADNENLISREQEVRHGRWKPFDLTWGRSIYFCTACNEAAEIPTFNGKPMYKWCPNCGACMVNEDE